MIYLFKLLEDNKEKLSYFFGFLNNEAIYIILNLFIQFKFVRTK